MPRVGLTTDRVVVEAELLADEVGIGQLSLVALAARLGVQPPSLYKHIAGQESLQQLLEVRAKAELADVMRDAAVGRSGADAVRALAHAYRLWAREHPGRYGFTLRAPDPLDEAATAASARAISVVFDALAGYGLTGDDAVDATRAFRAALHGFVSLESVGGFGMPVDIDRSYERLVDALAHSLAGWPRD